MVNDRWPDEIRLLDLPNISSLPSGDYNLKIVAKDERGIFKKSTPSETVVWAKPGTFTISANIENLPEGFEYGLVYGEYGGNEFELPGATPTQVFSIDDSSAELQINADCGTINGTIVATLNGNALSGTTQVNEGYKWFESDPFIPADGDIIHFEIVVDMPPEEQEDPGEY